MQPLWALVPSLGRWGGGFPNLDRLVGGKQMRRSLRKGQGKLRVPPADGPVGVGQRVAGWVLSPRGSPQAELQQKVEENEQLRLELQVVETERVRLSLLEEKLVDVLQLLQRLRDLVGSREVPPQGKGRGSREGAPACVGFSSR